MDETKRQMYNGRSARESIIKREKDSGVQEERWMTDGKGKREGEVGVSKKRTRGEKSENNASASCGGFFAIAAARGSATTAAAFAFGGFRILFVVEDFLGFDAHVDDIWGGVAKSTVCVCFC